MNQQNSNNITNTYKVTLSQLVNDQNELNIESYVRNASSQYLKEGIEVVL